MIAGVLPSRRLPGFPVPPRRSPAANAMMPVADGVSAVAGSLPSTSTNHTT
jgi:hypothetical protein